MPPAISVCLDRKAAADPRRMVARLLAFVLAMAGLVGPSSAAPPAIPPFVLAATPVAVRIVRSSDPRCVADHCSDWIALDGPIGPGSAAKFAHAVGALGRRRLPVLINSPGGLVTEAMAIGRLIREKHLDVAVTRTLLASCPSDRDACRQPTPDGLVAGLPDSRRALCASACPLILAAGTRRLVAPWAHVGVHQYVGFVKKTKVLRMFRVLTRVVNGVRVELSRTLVSQTPVPDSTVMVREQAHYEDTASYFARMGIGAGIMPLLRSAPASGIYWLTPEDLAATRVATDAMGGEDLVDGSGAPAVQTVAARMSPPAGVAAPPGTSSSYEIAALIDDAGQQVSSFSGHVTWGVERDAAQAGGTDLVADVALDDDAGTLTFRVAKYEDAPGHLTSRLFVRLLHGGNSPFRHIVALETPGLRKDAHALPDALLGRVEDTAPAVFSMVLSDTAQDVARDMALLSADQWVDVPVMIDADRTVRMTFALGASGSRAVRQWEGTSILRAAR